MSLLPMTRLQLDVMECHCGKCTDNVVFLNAACQPGAGAEVSYDKRSGILTSRCVRCKELIVHIKVAATLIEG